MFFNILAVVQGPRLSGRLREVSAMNLAYVSSNFEAVELSYDRFYEKGTQSSFLILLISNSRKIDKFQFFSIFFTDLSKKSMF